MSSSLTTRDPTCGRPSAIAILAPLEPRMRPLLALTLLAFSSSTIACAGAQPPAPPPAKTDADAKHRAAELYDEGNRRLDARDYAAALELFRQSDRAFPGPSQKLAVARTLDTMGRAEEAIAAYDLFLRSGLDPKAYADQLRQATARRDELRSPEAVARRRAAELYDEGLRRFDAHEYEAALDRFRGADAVFPGSTAKMRIALCLDALGRVEEAVVAYQALLASGLDERKQAGKIALAKARLSALQRSVAAPDDAPKPAASAPAGTGVSGHGRLEPAIIQKVIRERFAAFRECYEDGLRRDPNLTGRVEVRFVIGLDGNVSGLEEAASTIPDRDVTACVVRAFEAFVFPPPQGGIVTVVYPIMFSPGR